MAESLAGLESEYQILTELHRSAGTITYLARHLQLARDVTLTVVPASAEGGKVDLAQLEADVRTLIALRHPNIIPVLEGRWLDRRSFVIARARVRGSTLDQLLSAIGAVPLPRVRTTLEQVQAALAFARTSGVVARQVASESLVFQQGSGRVLIAFDPSAENAATRRSAGEDEDVRTIGRLARIMLAGRDDAGDTRSRLAQLRPDLSSSITGTADELAVGGNERDVIAFLSVLAAESSAAAAPSTIASRALPPTPAVPLISVASPTPSDSFPPRRATVARTTIGPQVVTPRVVSPIVAAAPVPSLVEVRPRRFGRRARWVAALVIVAALAATAGAIAVLQPHLLSSSAPSPAMPRAGSLAVATGDVADGIRQPPTAATQAPTSPQDSARGDSSRSAPLAATPVPSASAPDTTARAATPPITAPTGTTQTVIVPPVAAQPGSVATGAACSSPAPADQRKCFVDIVQRADADLNRVYSSLIDLLRRQARSAPDAPDPPSVDKLRSEQRMWLDERDRSCQAVGGGLFSGRDRGGCFADRAAKRSHALQLMLDSIPPGGTQ